MGFCYTRTMSVDPRNVQIIGENDERFWLHHGRKEEEKEDLRKFARMLPEAIDKYETGQTLTEDEEYAYDIFVKNGPRLEYDCINQCFNVIDGRHRMYMLREEGIQLEMQVSCYDISQQEKDMLQMQKVSIDGPKPNYFADLFNTMKECFENLVGKNRDETSLEQVERETIITKMAIVDNELNRSLVSVLDVDVYHTTDDQHLIVEGQGLEGAQDLFAEDEVIVLEERNL